MKTVLPKPTLLIGILLLLALANGCAGSGEPRSQLYYGLTLSPTGIDPHLNASAELGIPLSSVYDTLVVYDTASDSFTPGLATGWDISPDGLTYTFYLRDDVVFHDGSKFDSEAVRANIEYTLNPDHHSQKAAFMLGPLERTEVIDEFTIALVFSHPYAPILDSLSQVYLGMASPKALKEWGPKEYQFHQVGTGPYRFVEYIPNEHLTLQRNSDYAWVPEIYLAETASIDTIVFKFYEDPATRAIALSNGDVDVIGEVPPHDAERLAKEETFQLYPVPIPGQPLQYLLNTDRSPTDDLRVRQALIAGVDREQITGTIFGTHSPTATNILSRAHFNLDDHSQDMQYDPLLSARLLDEAGWRMASPGSYREKDGTLLEIDLVAPIWGSNVEVAQLVKAAWEKLGVKVNLEIAPGFGPLKEIQSSDRYHVIGMNLFGTDPDMLRSFFSSDGLYNWAHYENAELDKELLLASEMFNDLIKRTEQYNKIADHILGQALVLPIRDYTNLVVANSQVNGLRYSAQGWFPILIEAEQGS